MAKPSLRARLLAGVIALPMFLGIASTARAQDTPQPDAPTTSAQGADTPGLFGRISNSIFGSDAPKPHEAVVSAQAFGNMSYAAETLGGSLADSLRTNAKLSTMLAQDDKQITADNKQITELKVEIEQGGQNVGDLQSKLDGASHDKEILEGKQKGLTTAVNAFRSVAESQAKQINTAATQHTADVTQHTTDQAQIQTLQDNNNEDNWIIAGVGTLAALLAAGVLYMRRQGNKLRAALTGAQEELADKNNELAGVRKDLAEALAAAKPPVPPIPPALHHAPGDAATKDNLVESTNKEDLKRPVYSQGQIKVMKAFMKEHGGTHDKVDLDDGTVAHKFYDPGKNPLFTVSPRHMEYHVDFNKLDAPSQANFAKLGAGMFGANLNVSENIREEFTKTIKLLAEKGELLDQKGNKIDLKDIVINGKHLDGTVAVPVAQVVAEPIKQAETTAESGAEKKVELDLNAPPPVFNIDGFKVNGYNVKEATATFGGELSNYGMAYDPTKKKVSIGELKALSAAVDVADGQPVTHYHSLSANATEAQIQALAKKYYAVDQQPGLKSQVTGTDAQLAVYNKVRDELKAAAVVKEEAKVEAPAKPTFVGPIPEDIKRAAARHNRAGPSL